MSSINCSIVSCFNTIFGSIAFTNSYTVQHSYLIIYAYRQAIHVYMIHHTWQNLRMLTLHILICITKICVEVKFQESSILMVCFTCEKFALLKTFTHKNFCVYFTLSISEKQLSSSCNSVILSISAYFT